MIIPCIDLMGGAVVQLVQGRKKALEAGPLEAVLEKFANFPVLQVIDLDAARGSGSNEKIVRQLAAKRRVRVGGGVRTVEGAKRLLDCGAEKVIIGTSAFGPFGLHHIFLRALTAIVPKDAVILALDSRGDRIVVKGWEESLGFSAVEVIREVEPYCGGCLCTYVDKEGMMEGTDLEWFRKLRASTPVEITAAGGITTYKEIRTLQKMKVHVALGMAIYTGRLELEKLAEMAKGSV